MDTDIENILRRQAQVLPDEVREYVARANWGQAVDAVSERFQLSPENASTLQTETVLVLAGLVHLDEFKEAIKGELIGVDPVVIDTIAAEIGVAVFAPVRAALEEFFIEQEEVENEVQSGKSKVESEGESDVFMEVTPPVAPSRPLERMSDIAPDNLPTGEEVESGKSKVENEEDAPLMPKLTPKMRPSDDVEAAESDGTHPFEEKMKKVFTSGGADISNLELPPIGGVPVTPRSSIPDPYREPIV